MVFTFCIQCFPMDWEKNRMSFRHRSA